MTPKEIAERLRQSCGYQNVTPEVRGYDSNASNGLVLDAADLIDQLAAEIERRPWAINVKGQGRVTKQYHPALR